MPSNRELVDASLTPHLARLLWTSLFEPALPMTPQDFELSGVLPTMMYMARFGARRGAGRFHQTFPGSDAKGKTQTSINAVARVLASRRRDFDGFEDDTGRAILGDLLLTWCLENTKHAEGHDAKVARVYATHYFASWVDLPERAAHLRGVPELVTSILASQDNDDVLQKTALGENRKYAIGVPPDRNVLLDVFGRATRATNDNARDIKSDYLDEEEASSLGIDELIMARLASTIGEAPMPAAVGRGGVGRGAMIPNRKPASTRAAREFREDVLAFVRHFGSRMPRQAFAQLLECALSVGLAQVILRSARMLFELEQTGNPVQDPVARTPWPLFVDCSEGRDRVLRHFAESSMTETHRRFERLPVVMMVFRIVYETLRVDGDCAELIPHRRPDPTALLETLADTYRGSSEQATMMRHDIRRSCRRLASLLRQHQDEDPEREALAVALEDDGTHPVQRLAEALCELMGDSQQRGKYVMALDSAFGAARPTGLADRRNVTGTGLVRSVVMHTPMLDYLVHRHLVVDGQPGMLRQLSLKRFIDQLRARHGLWIDQAPPGMHVPADVLRRNKELLEARLRDLGLLLTVNDAETMKMLRARY